MGRSGPELSIWFAAYKSRSSKRVQRRFHEGTCHAADSPFIDSSFATISKVSPSPARMLASGQRWSIRLASRRLNAAFQGKASPTPNFLHRPKNRPVRCSKLSCHVGNHFRIPVRRMQYYAMITVRRPHARVSQMACCISSHRSTACDVHPSAFVQSWEAVLRLVACGRCRYVVATRY